MKRPILFWACLQGPTLLIILCMFAWEDHQKAIQMAIIAEISAFILAYLLSSFLDLLDWCLKDNNKK